MMLAKIMYLTKISKFPSIILNIKRIDFKMEFVSYNGIFRTKMIKKRFVKVSNQLLFVQKKKYMVQKCNRYVWLSFERKSYLIAKQKITENVQGLYKLYVKTQNCSVFMKIVIG